MLFRSALTRSRDFGEDVFAKHLQRIVDRFGLVPQTGSSSVTTPPIPPDENPLRLANPSPGATGEGSAGRLAGGRGE